MRAPSIGLLSLLLSSLTKAIPIESRSGSQVSRVPVSVELAQASPHSTKVKIRVKNTGREPLRIFKQSDLLTKANVRKLDVLHRDKSVDFHGLRVQFDRGKLSETDFEVINPGNSVERTVDVAECHDLTEGGDYLISAKGFLDTLDEHKRIGSFRAFGTPLLYKSNNLTIHVDGNKAGKVKRDVHQAYTRMQLHNDCSQEQQQVVQSAMSNCAQVAAQGAKGAQQGSAAFQAFFKTTDQSIQQNVADRLNAISQECAAAGSGVTTLHCVDDSGDPKGCTDRAIAFTYGLSGPPDIYLCQPFYTYTATPQSCGVNDQASTIVHELAHNTKVFSPGATDIPGGYGSQSTLQMDTQTALQNADSYSFFAAYEVLGCPVPRGGGGGGGGNAGAGPTGGSGGGTQGDGGNGGSNDGTGNAPATGGGDPYYYDPNGGTGDGSNTGGDPYTNQPNSGDNGDGSGYAGDQNGGGYYYTPGDQNGGGYNGDQNGDNYYTGDQNGGGYSGAGDQNDSGNYYTYDPNNGGGYSQPEDNSQPGYYGNEDIPNNEGSNYYNYPYSRG